MKFSDVHIGMLSKGDKRAFLLLYDNFFVSLTIFVQNFGLSKDDSEDIVQETFCRLNQNYNLPKNLNAFKSYLYTAVRNKSFNYIRDEKRRRFNESVFLDLQDDLLFFDKIVENELYREMHMFVNEMPPQCKNIFQRVLKGDTSEKIANDLNLSIETVKTQRKKAKRILRERYSLVYRSLYTFL
ncbi:MAG: sigma-70 family RNA polymerase sigma factor [Bacteroidales bacterium]|jgi:RNA polymerase sigma-70 factor (ECF subfamily)